MSKFQKRHYEAIARVLNGGDFGPKHVKAFALMLQHDNPAFDNDRFIDACVPIYLK
jgi:hypothetical protein